MLVASLYLARLVGPLVLLLGLTACTTSSRVAPEYYRVQPSDTLTHIARRAQQSVNNLMRWNHLSHADRIHVGQVLRVMPPKTSSKRRVRRVPKPLLAVPSIALVWPAAGTVAPRAPGVAAKGLSIMNVVGTPVVAAAAGKIVYAGNGLRGYGNLVIIQHEAEFMTIYAHNHRLLVQPGQLVQQGQIIAEMGKHNRPQAELYFELRHHGKPVDPSGAFLPMLK
jgi:murein DD-endopeptidase MepM/ murein hydrolase activator NlpD